MLKFILKKHSDNSQLEVGSFATMQEGDAWVARITGPGTYGRNQDISVLESELAEQGLAAEDAASSEVSDQPKLDEQGNPVMDSQEPPQPVMQLLYHFPREWDVEVIDITQELVQQGKVQDRAKARQFCLGMIDEIAAINEDLNDPQLMSSILSSPNFTAIILMLLTGGVKTARALMAQHGPGLYQQATVDGFVAKMDAFIASEN